MSLIRCNNVSFAYGGKDAVTQVDFEVNTGDYLCIIGENGAGKSTLIKGLLRLKKPSSGVITYGDGLKPDEIGYLPQQTESQKDFPASVYEVVLSGCLNRLGFRFFYSKEERRLAHENMELLGITDLSNRCYRDLSGGQQQRVLLARALCATKKLLLLDEPVTGLDPVIAGEMYRIIRELRDKKGITIIMVSHDVHGAVREADHILHLDHRQKFCGPTVRYINDPVGVAFLGGAVS
ncbi:zinc transport system ATP-binding protein [Lachnospiraceae bacterium]|nr:zinc transport system ATP-binding protein [Lachnospiraceae bacterium]